MLNFCYLCDSECIYSCCEEIKHEIINFFTVKTFNAMKCLPFCSDYAVGQSYTIYCLICLCMALCIITINQLINYRT